MKDHSKLAKRFLSSIFTDSSSEFIELKRACQTFRVYRDEDTGDGLPSTPNEAAVADLDDVDQM